MAAPPAHRDNTPATPTYEPLRTLCDLDPQISYYIPLSVASAGGELRVGNPALTTSAELFTPSPGDMILFPGSRFEHEVTRVTRLPVRRTIGGFCAVRRDGTGLCFWSQP